MRGLLLELYYKNRKSIYILNGFLIGIWLFINYFIDSQIVFFIFLAVVLLTNSLMVLLSQKKDYDLKLYRYEFLLPIDKKHIVLSKYIGQIMIIGLAVFILLILNFIGMKLGRNYYDYGYIDAVILLNILLAFIFQMISIFYVLLYFVDLEKGDLWVALGIIGSIALVVIEISLLNKLGFAKTSGNIILMVCYLLLFVLSYFLCAKKIKMVTLI